MVDRVVIETGQVEHRVDEHRVQPPGGSARIRELASGFQAAAGRTEDQPEVRDAARGCRRAWRAPSPVPGLAGLSAELDQEPDHPERRQAGDLVLIARSTPLRARLSRLVGACARTFGSPLSASLARRIALGGPDQPRVGGRQQAERDRQSPAC